MARTTVGVLAVLAVAVGMGGADAQEWSRSFDRCDQGWGDRDSERVCMVAEAEVATTGSLSVDGGLNGGIRIEGWSGDEVSLRAEIWARASSESRAEELASEVRLVARRGVVRAEGPDTGRRESWGVTWEILVPYETDLDLETHNGGIRVTDVDGDVRFEALNGGVRLAGMAGNVEGRTTNGGLHVELDGTRWQGAGLDVETTNGGVEIAVPEGYSADLEVATTNGGISLDFPVTVRGKIGRRLSTTLGEGGPRVRAVTTNGGVKVIRSTSAVRR